MSEPDRRDHGSARVTEGRACRHPRVDHRPDHREQRNPAGGSPAVV